MLLRLGYGKNAKIGTTRATRTEISQNIPVFSSSTPSVTSPDLTTPSTTIALKTRPKTANFAQKHEKATTSENSENFTIFSWKTPSSNFMDTAAPITIVTALKTHSEMTGFMINHPKIENSPSSTQKSPKAICPSIFEHSDDVS